MGRCGGERGSLRARAMQRTVVVLFSSSLLLVAIVIIIVIAQVHAIQTQPPSRRPIQARGDERGELEAQGFRIARPTAHVVRTRCRLSTAFYSILFYSTLFVAEYTLTYCTTLRIYHPTPPFLHSQQINKTSLSLVTCRLSLVTCHLSLHRFKGKKSSEPRGQFLITADAKVRRGCPLPPPPPSSSSSSSFSSSSANGRGMTKETAMPAVRLLRLQ